MLQQQGAEFNANAAMQKVAGAGTSKSSLQIPAANPAANPASEGNCKMLQCKMLQCCKVQESFLASGDGAKAEGTTHLGQEPLFPLREDTPVQLHDNPALLTTPHVASFSGFPLRPNSLLHVIAGEFAARANTV